MVYRVGLTGGIASGKSAVGAAFERLGVPVIDTDGLARETVAPGTAGLKAVVDRFGPSVLLPDGALDRRQLRQIVFADAEARRALESIVHPRVHGLLNDRVAALKTDYCILAIPLLVEGGRIPVDRVLVVDCPRETQLSRLLERDGETPEGAERILNAQATREARLARADDVLPNTGSLADLEREVGALHHRYQTLAGAR